MMRALAEFIMRGRAQAALVAVLGSLLPLISPAAVSLVTLRRTAADGALLALWALLPVLAAFYLGQMNPMIIWVSAAGVFVVVAMSEVLKRSVSWPWTLLAAVVFSGLAVVVLAGMLPEQVALLKSDMDVLFRQLQAPGGKQVLPGKTFLLGFMAWMIALNALGSLLLARWWQAVLYNPGGFRQEFHALRMDRVSAAILLAGMTACYLLSAGYLGADTQAGSALAKEVQADYMTWAALLGLPLLFAGIGLVHHTVAVRKMGVHWLVIFYLGLLLIGPLSMLLIGLAFLDSLLDLRPRLAKR